MMLDRDKEITLTKHLLRELYVAADNDDKEARNKADMLAERIYNAATQERHSEQSLLQGIGFINKVVCHKDNLYVDIALRSGHKSDNSGIHYENYRLSVLKDSYLKFFSGVKDSAPFPLESVLVRLEISNPRSGVNVDDSGKAWPRRNGILRRWEIV